MPANESRISRRCACRSKRRLLRLEEAPKIITLHPATLDRYVETVDALGHESCRARRG